MELASKRIDELVKVAIELDDAQVGVETVWAEQLSDGSYVLRNVPFLAYGYSEQDVVSASYVERRLMVTGVVSRGGHSTYRLFFAHPLTDEDFSPLWKPLGELGCTYERANSRLIGIDVPPRSDVYAVYRALELGEATGHWTFEEGHCGHLLHG